MHANASHVAVEFLPVRNWSWWILCSKQSAVGAAHRRLRQLLQAQTITSHLHCFGTSTDAVNPPRGPDRPPLALARATLVTEYSDNLRSLDYIAVVRMHYGVCKVGPTYWGRFNKTITEVQSASC